MHNAGMFLLRFTFQNHCSFRDEADLTLVRPNLHTRRPTAGSWSDYTAPVAAIYGANASGKSGVLDAFRYMHSMLHSAAPSWPKTKRLPRAAFALDEVSRDQPSTFSLDFVLDDVRYEYGFSLTAKEITEEWLYTYPTGRKKVMFERAAEPEQLTFGRALGGGEATLAKVTGKDELVLAKGALLHNRQLERVWKELREGIVVAEFGDMVRHSRLRSIVKEVADGSFDLEDLRIMLKVADIGIAGAEVRDEEADPKLAKLLKAVISAGFDAGKGDVGEALEELPDDRFEEMLAEIARSLMFNHTGADGKTYPLPTSKQSTGTLTWLSLAAPALKVIRQGGVFAVDELDASLHPQLAEVLIQMFQDSTINTKHSQLIFTTHDTYFMSPTSSVKLGSDEVWFVEKGRNGVSELFRLSDFPTRGEQNFSRRYLQGRYGGVPSVAPSFLASLAERAPEGRRDMSEEVLV